MSRLRELAEQATPGPWQVERDDDYDEMAERSYSWPWRIPGVCNFVDEEGKRAEEDARLIALAPDLCVLLADAKDVLEHIEKHWGGPLAGTSALLARIEELEGKA